MLNIKQLRTSHFDANCYVVWPEGATEALVIDPGPGTAAKVASVLADNEVSLGAILLTHGHFDHIWDASELVETADDGDEGIDIFIPGPDLFWLDDPTASVGLSLSHLGLSEWKKPERVKAIENLEWQPTEGVTLRMIPAPGHSPGSSVYLVGVEGLEAPLAFSGDVVFQGSIGRTDLAHGDDEEMSESLRTLAAVLDPDTVMLPGHGPSTSWGTERRKNPYVRRALR